MMKLLFVTMFLNFPLMASAIEVPRQFSTGKSDFNYRVFGDACYTMDNSFHSLPCNAAFLNKEKNQEDRWFGHLYAGENVTYIKDVQAIIDNKATTETVRNVIEQNRSSEIEAAFEFGFLGDHWGVSVDPARVNYYTLFRNRALPYISLYASLEQVARLQYAAEIGNDLYWGVELKGVHRKFALSEFYLTDALVEGGTERVLPVRKQDTLSLGPGVVWVPQGVALNPQVSATITQAGYVSEKFEGLRTEPEGQLGASMKPELGDGIFEVGLVGTFGPEYDKMTDLMRLAASYKADALTLAGSVNENRLDFGIHFQLSAFDAGLVYDHRTFTNVEGDRDHANTVYAQLGFIL